MRCCHSRDVILQSALSMFLILPSSMSSQVTRTHLEIILLEMTLLFNSSRLSKPFQKRMHTHGAELSGVTKLIHLFLKPTLTQKLRYRACMHTHIHTYTHNVHTHDHMPMCTHVHILCNPTHMHVRAHTHTNTQAHTTHMHTHTEPLPV